MPIHGIEAGRCTCGTPACSSRGKHPILRNGVRGATADERTIRGWFSKWPHANLAVVTGEVSGIVVLDIDGDAGRQSLQALMDRLGPLPTGPTAKTARGRHCVFRWPGGKVANRVGAAPGIDFKGDGGYVVVAPSIHANGAVYTWETSPEEVPPPELPTNWVDWLSRGDVIQRAQRVQRVQEGPGESRRVQRVQEIENSPSASHSSKLSGSVEEVILATQPTGPGQRRFHVFKLAKNLKGIPEVANMPSKDLRPIVREWHRRALPRIRTKEWEATWFDFTDAWERVRHPGDSNPVVEALARAKAGALPGAAKDYEHPALRLLVALCRELQRHAVDRPFFLSCEDAAQLLGDGAHPSPMTVWRWLGGLVRDGVLSLEKRGDRRTANEYRYLAEI